MAVLTQLQVQSLEPAITLALGSFRTSPSESAHAAARAAVLSALRQCLGASEVVLEHHPSGAPYLPSLPSCNISLSHTEQHIALLLDEQGAAVGIDIEAYRSSLQRVRPRFLTDEELTIAADANKKLHTPLTEEALLQLLWSAKEAAFKYANSPDNSLLYYRLRALSQGEGKTLRLELESALGRLPLEAQPYEDCWVVYHHRALL